MKVIKEGTGQNGWAKELKCTGKGNGAGGCGAVLLVEEGDLFKTSSTARDETTDYITFECCSCNVWTDVTDSKIPYRVTENLRHRAPNRSNQNGR